MGTTINRRLAVRKLETRAAHAALIAKAALKQKLLAKADMRAARKSLKRAKKVAKQAGKSARVAAKKAGVRQAT